MILNGIEFEVDFTDADILEAIDRESQVVLEKSNELEKNKENLSPAEGIRQECKIVKEFLDNVLGEGTSEKIFGNKDSLNLCLDVYDEIIKTYQEQYKTYYERINKYSPDRLQR